jgi:hypothetical protein
MHADRRVSDRIMMQRLSAADGEHRYIAQVIRNDVRTICIVNGINLDARLPIRR